MEAPDPLAGALVTPAVLAVLIAVGLFVAGIPIALDYRGFATWLAKRSKGRGYWYTTRAGMRWEGAGMMAFSLALGGLLLGGSLIPALRVLGAVSLVVGLTVLLVLMAYGTLAFYRYRP